MRQAIRTAATTGALALLLSVAPFSASAQDPFADDTPYRYEIIETGLVDALRDLGANLGIQVAISPTVTGRVTGPLPEGSARAFLDRLAQQFGFADYFDGQVLHVTPIEANETRILSTREVTLAALSRSLASLGLDDPRYPLRQAAGGEVAFVSGPPRYIALVEATLQALSDGAPAPIDPASPVATVSADGRPITRERGAMPLIVFRGEAVTVYPNGRPQ